MQRCDLKLAKEILEDELYKGNSIKTFSQNLKCKLHGGDRGKVKGITKTVGFMLRGP